jgi:hypothetical protein
MFDKSEDSFHYIVLRNDLNINLIGRFIIKTSSKVIILDRKYQKLPSFIGQLSGMIEEIFIVIFFIINIIEKQAIVNKLIHKMLKIKGSKIYDINYFVNIFKKNRINNNILNLINLQNLDIKKYNEKIQNLSFKNSKFL